MVEGPEWNGLTRNIMGDILLSNLLYLRKSWWELNSNWWKPMAEAVHFGNHAQRLKSMPHGTRQPNDIQLNKPHD